jgi:hypothetical protein
MPTTRTSQYTDGLQGENLPARSGGAQSCRLHGGNAVVVASPFRDVASAYADAHIEPDVGSLVATRDLALDLGCCRDCFGGSRKHGHEPVARVLDHLAVMGVDRAADERIVLVSHRVESILSKGDQQLRRTDQVREHHDDCAHCWHPSSVRRTIIASLCRLLVDPGIRSGRGRVASASGRTLHW